MDIAKILFYVAMMLVLLICGCEIGMCWLGMVLSLVLIVINEKFNIMGMEVI